MVRTMVFCISIFSIKCLKIKNSIICNFYIFSDNFYVPLLHDGNLHIEIKCDQVQLRC